VKQIPATPENLASDIAIKPITRWLIQAARERTSLSYGRAKERLEAECGFATIFAPMMGRPCGTLMERIQEKYPDAPLLNILMVNASDGYAGPGAGYFLAKRFRKRRLEKEGIRDADWNLWTKHCDKAAQEVYAYGDKWDAIFQNVFDEQWEPAPPRDGAEKDGTRFGEGGEGPNHKALRLWTRANPHRIGRRYAGYRAETEVMLASADRVDVVYYGEAETIALEVKSKDSNYEDLRRGVFQCIKYRAVMQAMDIRDKPQVEAVLVTQTPLPVDLMAITRKNGIRHYQAPKSIEAV